MVPLILVCFAFLFGSLSIQGVERSVLLESSRFNRQVYFENPSQGQLETRKFSEVEIDDDGNVLFRSKDQPPLILPMRRIRAVVPVPPERMEGYSLENLKEGLAKCSQGLGQSPEIEDLVQQWKLLVAQKVQTREFEHQQKMVAQDQAIREAALQKAAEELSSARLYVEKFDQLLTRQEMQEGLEITNRLDLRLLANSSEVEEARHFWSTLLALPPQVAIPSQWPWRIAVEQLIVSTQGKSPGKGAWFAYPVFGVLLVIAFYFLSRCLVALRNQALFGIILFSGLGLTFLGLLISVFFLISPPAKPPHLIFMEKADWQDGRVFEALLLRDGKNIQLRISLCLGPSFISMPLALQFEQGFEKSPSELRVKEAFLGIIPVPRPVGQRIWSILSGDYAWAA